MTAYQLITELAKHEPDTEIKIDDTDCPDGINNLTRADYTGDKDGNWYWVLR